VDISGDYLNASATELQKRFPSLDVLPVIADFARPFSLPGGLEQLPKLGFFPGSTIGNFVPRSATDLLRHFRELLGVGSQLLIGMDRVKPIDRLLAAYDEPEGITAEFNLNLLKRINRELDGDIPVDEFRHEARWNDILSRIEMHLLPTRDVEFTIAGQRFITTIRPAASARCAAASSITPSCIHTAPAPASIASSTCAPARSAGRKMSTTSIRSVSGTACRVG